jgi:hypothetical protein
MMSWSVLQARVTSGMASLLWTVLLVTSNGLAAEPIESHESRNWRIYHSSSGGCSDTESSLSLSLVDGAISVSAGHHSGGVVRFAREASTLVFLLGETGCRYGVVVSRSGRISFDQLRSLTHSVVLAPLGTDRLEFISAVAGARCTISTVLFALRSGNLNLQIGAIASQGAQVRLGEPQVISDGNISVTLNQPPCSIDITGTKLD